MTDEFMYRCISLKELNLSNNNNNNKSEKDNQPEVAKNLDMMTIYMEDDKENSYSTKFLKDVALNLLFAERDTTTVSLTWFFWLVATHPSVETKIVEEMKSILLAKDNKYYGSLVTNDLNKFVYLQAALTL